MKKIARYISIMMIVVFMTGCEENSATIQSTISDSVEVNQNESAESHVTTSAEEDKTLDKSEIETQVVQTEVTKDDNHGQNQRCYCFYFYKSRVIQLWTWRKRIVFVSVYDYRN